eukprot:1152836-Pelagomonas_calceolata.AAC.3
MAVAVNLNPGRRCSIGRLSRQIMVIWSDMPPQNNKLRLTLILPDKMHSTKDKIQMHYMIQVVLHESSRQEAEPLA